MTNHHEHRTAKAAAKAIKRKKRGGSDLQAIRNPDGFIHKFRTMPASPAVAAMYSWRRLGQQRGR